MYEVVIVRNRSCPAVSQISSLTRLPFKSKYLLMKGGEVAGGGV